MLSHAVSADKNRNAAAAFCRLRQSFKLINTRNAYSFSGELCVIGIVMYQLAEGENPVAVVCGDLLRDHIGGALDAEAKARVFCNRYFVAVHFDSSFPRSIIRSKIYCVIALESPAISPPFVYSS